MNHYDNLVVSGDDQVRTIALNRPDVLNACDTKTYEELQAAVQSAEKDTNVRAVIFAGEGRAFCAGADVRETSSLTQQAALEYVQLDFATKCAIASLSKPTIAAVHGYCLGGGAELALACDIRILSEDAVVGFPETARGTIPGSGGLQRLPLVVGRGVAAEWILTGMEFSAQRCLSVGFANNLVPEIQLRDVSHDMAALMSQRDPLAIRLVKVALDPHPYSSSGLTATYQQLASAACHGLKP